MIRYKMSRYFILPFFTLFTTFLFLGNFSPIQGQTIPPNGTINNGPARAMAGYEMVKLDITNILYDFHYEDAWRHTH